MYTVALLYVKFCPADCSGWELHLRLPLQDLDIRRDASVATGGVFIADVNSAGSYDLVGYASGTLGRALPKFFFSA
jgi:hypothetical protein